MPPQADEIITLPSAPLRAAGQRIDQFVAETLASMEKERHLSRQRVQALLEQGCVTLHNKPVTKKNHKVSPGDVYTLTCPPPLPMTLTPEAIPLQVLYEDTHLIVVNKPAHMATHPGPGSMTGTLVHALLHHCKKSLSGIGGVERPGIVHRLDKGTSGIMVVAKDDATHQHLALQFKNRTIDRRYMALCYGTPIPSKGTIEGNIGRNPRHRKKMAVLTTGGKPAKTTYVVEETSPYAISRVSLKLHSGRTHQIRVHLTHLGHPLLGDPTYGRKRRLLGTPPCQVQAVINALSRQALHAYKLGFIHPKTNKTHTFEAPPPEDIQKILEIIHLKSIE